MKVGILIDRFNVGGVEKIALEQVAALRSAGVDATLLVLSQKGLFPDAFIELQKKVPIRYLDRNLPNFLKHSFKFPVFHFFSFFHISYPFLLPFVLKRHEYSYIICHGTFTCFSAISFKYLSGIPYSAFIWDPIGYILKKVYEQSFNRILFTILLYVGKLLDQLIVRTADEILVGGQAHNTYFTSLSKKVKISVIPPSVHQVPKMNTKNRSGVLMVTAWKRGKNPEFIFKLLSRMPDMKVNIVGKWLDESYKQEFENKIEKFQLTNNILVLGAVSEAELFEQYSHAAVFLQINDDRGFGMPALESASHGTPFIIPKNQGVCELFNQGVHGYFTDEMNITEIADHLAALLVNHELADQMGSACFKTVQQNYSWKRHAQDLLQVCVRNAS